MMALDFKVKAAVVVLLINDYLTIFSDTSMV